MTMPRSHPCRMKPWNPSPASPTRSRCGACRWRTRGRCGSRRRFRCFRRRAAGGTVGSRDRRRYDGSDACQIAGDGRPARDGACGVSRRLAEALPVDDDWADVVISNGVSISAPTNVRSSPKSIACSGRTVFCNLQISQTASRCRRPSTTSISGPLELPVVCRVQPGNKCSKKPVLSMCGSDRRLTLFKVPAVRRTREDSRFTATPSSRENADRGRLGSGGMRPPLSAMNEHHDDDIQFIGGNAETQDP